MLVIVRQGLAEEEEEEVLMVIAPSNIRHGSSLKSGHQLCDQHCLLRVKHHGRIILNTKIHTAQSLRPLRIMISNWIFVLLWDIDWCPRLFPARGCDRISMAPQTSPGAWVRWDIDWRPRLVQVGVWVRWDIWSPRLARVLSVCAYPWVAGGPP
jgi:hypothetical protein